MSWNRCSGPSGMPSSGAHGRFGCFWGAQEQKRNFRTGTKRWVGERDTSAKAASLAIIRRFRSVGFGEREQSGEAEIVENLARGGGIFDSGRYTHPAAAART